MIAVSDPAAAQTVRDAGGISKVVTRSKAELASIHRELDRLGGIPNTAWGVKPDTNQVSVKIFDGAPSDSRARIEKVVAAHPGAIHIDRIRSTLKFKSTDLRGGNGITSDGYRCTAGFNTKNSSGTIYTLTAGHCPGSDYYMDWNNQRIGYVAYSHFGGSGGDQATIRANDPGINPLGTVRYWGGTYKQIDSSRFAIIGEHIDRIGVSSQDTTGSVTTASVASWSPVKKSRHQRPPHTASKRLRHLRHAGPFTRSIPMLHWQVPQCCQNSGSGTDFVIGYGACWPLVPGSGALMARSSSSLAARSSARAGTW